MSEPGLNILIVEDNPGDQVLLTELLKLSSIVIKQLLYASTLSQASSITMNNNIEVILLDLSLPDSSGLETFRSLKFFADKIPVIILSGLSDTEIALQAIKEGAQDYLMKDDFDEKILAKTIRYSIERKHNLEQINHFNERYKMVSKATNDMVWDWDIKKNTLYRNAEQFVRILKLPAEQKDNSGDFWLSHIHPDDRSNVAATVNQWHIDTTQKTFEIEYRFLRGDNNYIYLSDRGYVVRDENGEVNRIIGAIRDITDKKKSEQALKKSEEQYRYLFDNNPACIFIWHLDDLSIAVANETASSQYGYSLEEFKKISVTKIRPPGDIPQIKKFAEDALQQENFYATSIWKHLNKQQEEMHMEISSRRISFNERPAILAIAFNVTDKIALQQKLQEEKNKKALQITLAVISAQDKEREAIGKELHDNINQILAGAKLYLGLAKNGLTNYHSGLDKTDELINSAIDEIRVLSHSLIPPSMQEEEFADALDDIIQTTMTGNSFTIEKKIEPFDKKIMTPQMRLTIYRIIQEQFNNILKYAAPSKVWLTIYQAGDEIMLSIKDDGKGFDLSAKTNGVGLMNIKTRASLFNGELTVISTPGGGCEIKVGFNCQKMTDN